MIIFASVCKELVAQSKLIFLDKILLLKYDIVKKLLSNDSIVHLSKYETVTAVRKGIYLTSYLIRQKYMPV